MDNETRVANIKKVAVVLIPILFAIVTAVVVATMMGGGLALIPSEGEGSELPPPTESDIQASADPDKGSEDYSEGLTYALNADGSATVIGIGSCADRVVKIPDKTADGARVTSIGDSAFASLEGIDEVILPSGVVSVGSYAFKGSSVISVSLGGSVMTLGTSVFSGCTRLTEIRVDGANPVLASRDGVLFDRDMSTLILYPAGKTDTSYTIPASVRKIGTGAFSACPALRAIKYEGNDKEWKGVYVSAGNTLLESIAVEVDTSDK